MVKLTELATGAEGQIVDITSENLVRERLLELGVAPGRGLRVVHRLPLSGPMVVQAGSTFIALREFEAETIWVELV